MALSVGVFKRNWNSLFRASLLRLSFGVVAKEIRVSLSGRVQPGRRSRSPSRTGREEESVAMDPNVHEYGYGDRIDPHVAVSKGWISLVPEAAVLPGVKAAVALAAIFLLAQVARWWRQAAPRNPFAEDDRRKEPREGGPELDKKKRDRVLKQGFHPDKVPRDLDAVVIGSGIGGLTCAAVLAKAGRKVLVLEQHDQAGGCCHTYIDKGYEFDVGVHYVGGMHRNTISKFLLDQISGGNIEWANMEDAYDTVTIGFDENRRSYPLTSGREKWRQLLKKQFPGEDKAIDEFFELLDVSRGDIKAHIMLKMIPLWAAWLLTKTGLVNLISGQWSGKFDQSCIDLCRSLTSNEDLQAVLTYCWGDYGTDPAESNFFIQSLLLNHYVEGASYPVGGASEIAYNIIPVIERSGGRVLVRAAVQEILHNGKKAMGVLVKKGGGEYRVEAPVVISAAGLHNTFNRLLPLSLSKASYFNGVASELKAGKPLFSVFVGLNASNEELGLKAENIWAFGSSDTAGVMRGYLDKSAEQVMDTDLPLLFISFPSAKDPHWSKHPGRASKSTCAIITVAKWEWYEKFKNTEPKRRGDEYEELKKAVADRMIKQTTKLFPQIERHIDYVDVSSPTLLVCHRYLLSRT